jgi:hypothetical protein
MKKYFILLFFIVGGCSGPYSLGTAYEYKYKLITANSTNQSWTNDTIAIVFSFSRSSINFSLNNLTNETMKLRWDDATLIKHGSARRIMHSGVKYIDRNNSQPPTIIPGMTTINDVVIPVDNIRWRDGYYGRNYSTPGEWVEDPLFPEHDINKPEFREAILKYKGVVFSLILPIEHKNIVKEYKFEFEITSVAPIKSK